MENDTGCISNRPLVRAHGWYSKFHTTLDDVLAIVCTEKRGLTGATASAVLLNDPMSQIQANHLANRVQTTLYALREGLTSLDNNSGIESG